MNKSKLLVAVATLATIFASPAHAAINAAVEYTSASTLNDSRAFTLGYSFSLSGPVTVNALGIWDDGLGNAHRVGIWDSSNALVATTNVLGTDSLVGHFRWATISNVVLNAGNYVIGGEFLGNGNPFVSSASGITSISQYSYGQVRHLLGSGLNLPTLNSGNYGPNGILYASFSVEDANGAVPEPATWAMMLLGFGVVGGAMRRRQNVTVSFA